LSGYSELVAEVNKNCKTMELSDAIVAAVKTCISKGILLSFLESHASEVLNMLFTEWNLEDAIAVAKEEAVEDRDLQIAKEMLADGIEPARVARITKLSEDQVMALR